MSNFYKMNRTCDFKVKLKESMNNAGKSRTPTFCISSITSQNTAKITIKGNSFYAGTVYNGCFPYQFDKK